MPSPWAPRRPSLPTSLHTGITLAARGCKSHAAHLGNSLLPHSGIPRISRSHLPQGTQYVMKHINFAAGRCMQRAADIGGLLLPQSKTPSTTWSHHVKSYQMSRSRFMPKQDARSGGKHALHKQLKSAACLQVAQAACCGPSWEAWECMRPLHNHATV